jgi:uncharacterized protein YciI
LEYSFITFKILENNKLHFIYIVKPFKDNFNETATDEENLIMGEHFIYLKKLLEEKTLILAGPELNAKFGIAVLETDSEEKASDIMKNDPAVAKGVFSAQLYPFRISLFRSYT